MPQATLYDVIAGTDTYIRQVIATEPTMNNKVEAGRASAGVDPLALFITDAEPKMRVSSTDIAGTIGIVSLTQGLDIDDDLWALPFNVRAAGGSFAGSASHTVLSGANAFVVPRQVQVSQGRHATIDLEFLLQSDDGFNPPSAATTDQSLAATAFNGLWTQGPAYLNTTNVGGSVGFAVDPGFTVEPLEKADGELYPRDHSIRMRDPSITLDFLNVDALDIFAEHFLTMTAFVCYLRKRAAGSAFVAPATTEHISFAFADGVADIQKVSAQDNQTARPGLKLWGEALTVSTSAAIP